MRTLFKGFIIVLLALILVGCSEDTASNDNINTQIYSIYEIALEADTSDMTYEEWLKTVKGPQGEDGREVSLRVDDGAIQWRYVGDDRWINLVKLTTLTGSDGKSVVFQVANDHIQWQYVGDDTWTNLIALDTLTGNDGKNVELHVTEGFIQWKHTGDDVWMNLVDLTTLTGEDGREVSFRVDGGMIQWQYIGNKTWRNLIALETLTGNDGKNVELQVTEGFIQWKHTGDDVWMNLVDLTTLTGKDGREVSFRVDEGAIQWQYVGDDTWTNLITLETLTGNDGKNVELQVTEGFIQWKHTGDDTWMNLVDLKTLTGKDGREVSFRVDEGAIQWQYVGDDTWTNLIALDTLTGEDAKDVTFQVTDNTIQWQYIGDNTWTDLIDLNNVIDVSGIESSITALEDRVTQLESDLESSDLQEQLSTTIDTVTSSVVGVKTYQSDEYVALGSGVIYKQIEDTYYVITNYHVVESGDNFKVYLHDNSEKSATLVGYDYYSDLAVLTFTTTNTYTTSSLGDSNLLMPGDFVFAMGSPLGLANYNSVTFGIISGTNRLLPSYLDDTYYGELFIQHDAAINPGNSGGPLFDLEGNVIGINSRKYVGDYVDTMGYSIPSNAVSNVISVIETGEFYKHAGNWYETMISVNYVRNNPSLYPEITIPDTVINGVYVDTPDPDGIFGLAGMQDGDIILAINDTLVNFWYEVKHQIYYQNLPTDNITFTVHRNGSVVELTYNPTTYTYGYYWYEVITFSNRDMYYGEMYDYYMHGDGAYYFSDEDYYIGEFSFDEPNGFGTYYWPNGDYFEADWIDWDNTTNGIYYYADGTTENKNLQNGYWVYY
ncbi:MAG: trypsin-like peptidase domain-containing protein [Candidatus Izemoplasma sp.]|nr:trypsin-like peptidase domain-containing protein [Candidatus Izemoplasma sp.]